MVVSGGNWFCLCVWRITYEQREHYHICVKYNQEQLLLSAFHGFREVLEGRETLVWKLHREVQLTAPLLRLCLFSFYLSFLSTSAHGKGRGESSATEGVPAFPGSSVIAPYQKALFIGPNKNAHGDPVVREEVGRGMQG